TAAGHCWQPTFAAKAAFWPRVKPGMIPSRRPLDRVSEQQAFSGRMKYLMTVKVPGDKDPGLLCFLGEDLETQGRFGLLSEQAHQPVRFFPRGFLVAIKYGADDPDVLFGDIGKVALGVEAEPESPAMSL